METKEIITEEEAREIIINSEWSVKNVKFFAGHDADQMSCSLYMDGKRVATVLDDSWGGGFQCNWIKTDMTKDFECFAKCITVESKYFDDGTTYNGDIVVDVLVNHFEEVKQMEKWCKGKIVFRLKGDNDGEWRTVKLPFNPTNRRRVELHCGDKLEEILNDRFV